MTFFYKFQKAFGFTLFRSRTKNIEIWFFPPKFSVGKHYHENFNGKLLLIAGNVFLCKQDEETSETKKTDKHWKWFALPARTVHWFENKGSKWTPTIFINSETWFNNNPTSACKDFIKV